MTQEEKAKAYDKVREKIAIRFGSNVADEIFSQFEMSEDERVRKAIIEFFELQDDNTTYSFIPKNDILAWLEKQGEKKPVEWEQENVEELTDFENAMMHIGNSFFSANAGLDPNDTETVRSQANLLLELAQNPVEWSEEDDGMIKFLLTFFRKEQHATEESHIITWLKSLKDRVQPQPKQDWSEKDEKCFNILISLINNPSSDGIFDYHQINKSAFNNWVKSLRPQKQWKPTEDNTDQAISILEKAAKDIKIPEKYKTSDWLCEKEDDLIENLHRQLRDNILRAKEEAKNKI